MGLEGLISARGKNAASKDDPRNEEVCLDTNRVNFHSDSLSSSGEFFMRISRLLTTGDSHIIFAPEGETNPWPRLKKLKSGAVRTGLTAVLSGGGSSSSDRFNKSIQISHETWLVPTILSFKATGIIHRDVCIEIGSPVKIKHINVSAAFHAVGVVTGVGTNVTSLVNSDAGFVLTRHITDQLVRSMGSLADIIPDTTPAPFHNGNQAQELSSTDLKSQLLDLKILTNLSQCILILVEHFDIAHLNIKDQTIDFFEVNKNTWYYQIILTRSLGKYIG